MGITKSSAFRCTAVCRFVPNHAAQHHCETPKHCGAPGLPWRTRFLMLATQLKFGSTSADGTARRVAMPAPPCQHACSVLIIRSHNHLCTVGAGRSAARMWINRDRRDEIRQLNSLSLNSCSVTVVAGRRASVPISIWCPCVSLPNVCGHHEQLTVLRTLSYPRTYAH